MGRKINDEDYILTNQRTRGTAVIRKNDYEREDAFVWMKGLKIRTDLAHSFLGSTAPEPLPHLAADSHGWFLRVAFSGNPNCLADPQDVCNHAPRINCAMEAQGGGQNRQKY